MKKFEIDFYVLPTPLISKISLELVKKVRQYNFSGSDESNMVYVVARKSPRKNKLDEVIAIGIKSETDSGSRKASSGAH